MEKKNFRAQMVLHGDTIAVLAEFLGITENSLYNKINGAGTEFKQGEIRAIKDRWGLTAQEAEAIFFAD